MLEVQQVCFGPYTENFSRRSYDKRRDPSYRCFSLLLRTSNRSLDFAFEDDADTMDWLLALQTLVCFFSPVRCHTESSVRLP